MVKVHSDSQNLLQMSSFAVGTPCRLNENGKLVECVVIKNSRGQLQIRSRDGRTRWLDQKEVKNFLRPLNLEDDDDSSTSSADDDDRGRMQTETSPTPKGPEEPKFATTDGMDGVEYGDADSSDDEKRLRANSTYVREADDAEDVYTQLRDEWDVGSLVEIWSDSGSRWVVAQIMKFENVEGYDEETVIVLYRVENDDGSITTISKRVLITSQHLRPFVNKPDVPADVNAELQELRVINDEFLLTIDHQSETMAQLQKICGELQREKDEQEATISDLENTIAKQSKIIAQLMASIEDNEMLSDVSDSEGSR